MADINTLRLGDIYPLASETTSQGTTPGFGMRETAETASRPPTNPVVGFVAAVLVLIGLWTIVRQVVAEDDVFRNVRVSGYNALITALMVGAVMPLIKTGLVFASQRVPLLAPVRDWYLAV